MIPAIKQAQDLYQKTQQNQRKRVVSNSRNPNSVERA